MYLLLGMKQAAWLTSTGQYSTDVSVARKFERDEAVAISKRHKEASNILILVREEDLV